MMPSAGCGCRCCTTFSDRLQRDAEDIDGIDSTTNWNCYPDDVWRIVAPTIIPGYLECRAGSETGPFTATWTGTPTRHFSCTARVAASGIAGAGPDYSDTPKFRIVYVATSSDSPLTRRYAAEIEFIAGDSGADTDECGYLRLYDLTNLLSPVELAAAPVGQLVHRLGLNLTMCYDPETQLLIASVTSNGSVNNVFGKLQSIHAKGVDTDPAELDSASIYLEWELEEDAVGVVASFKVSQTKNLDNGDTDPSGIADEEDPDCPCCRPSRCSATVLTFDGSTIDCRLLQSLGTWTQSGGKISTSSTGRLSWLGSWAGVNDDCLPDCTWKVWVEVKGPEEASDLFQWRIELVDVDDSVRAYADLYLSCVDPESPLEGQLTIGRIVGIGGLEQLDVTEVSFEPGAMVRFSFCFMYGEFTAIATSGGDTFTADYSNSTGSDWDDGGYSYGEDGGAFDDFCPSGVQLVAPRTGGTDFYEFGVSHNLDSPECEDCFGGDDDGPGTTPHDDPDACPPDDPGQNCIGGEYPTKLKVRLNVVPGPGATCEELCFDFSGTYLLSVGPTYTPPGGEGTIGCGTQSTGIIPMLCDEPDMDLDAYEGLQCSCGWYGCFSLANPCSEPFNVGISFIALLQRLAGGEYRMVVHVTVDSFNPVCSGESPGGIDGGWTLWSESLGTSPIDCANNLSGDLTLYCHQTPFFGTPGLCDWLDSTASGSFGAV